MTYSITALTKAADCDALIKMAEKEKDNLEFRQTSLQRQKDTYAENSTELKAEIGAITTELAATETIIAALPEGDTKEANITKKQKLELKKRLLTLREADYGAIALLDREFDLVRVEKELEETHAFIAAIRERKAVL